MVCTSMANIHSGSKIQTLCNVTSVTDYMYKQDFIRFVVQSDMQNTVQEVQCLRGATPHFL